MQYRQFSHETQPRSPRACEIVETPLSATCLQIVDWGLLGIIFIAPLFFGGRHTLGRGVFICLAAITAIAWFIRQASLQKAIWTRTKATWIAIAAITIVSVQLVPLPSDWLEQIAPRNTSLLSLWNSRSNLSLGTWETISLAPMATSLALATLVAYVLLFVTAIGRLQTQKDIERLLKLIAIAAVLMGVFGLLQYFTSNGRFFWFYEYPYSDTKMGVKGSFTCRNHFAHFLVLGFGPLIAWTVQRLHHKKTSNNRSLFTSAQLNAVMIFCLILVVFAVLLSLSRGGAIALMTVSTIAVALYYRRGLVTGTHLYGLTTLALLVIGLLSLHGSDLVAKRLNNIASGSIAEIDRNEGRRAIWNANLAAIKEGGLLGSGAGSHREIYPIYLPKSLPYEYTHAENGYLQIATENGAMGVALLVLAILMVSSWCWSAVRNSQSDRSLILAGAVSASLVASLVHSLVDFVWFIPACMSITILLAACALRLAQLAISEEVETSSSRPLARSSWVGMAMGTSLAALWAISVVVKPAWASTQWDRYLITSSAMKAHTSLRLVKGEQVDEGEAHQLALTENAIFYLQRTYARNPGSARTNLRLAGKYLQLFGLRQRKSDNAMSIDQIRDAAMLSQFASAAELHKWLEKAFGQNSKLLYRAYFHTRRALKLCPLQGEGYLYLANLCFLEGRPHEAIDAYLSQSSQVRPHDGQVLFEIGRQQLLLGHSEEALTYWKKIFHDAGNHQLQIVQLLAGRVPADMFVEAFQPDWITLPYLWRQYRQLGNEQDWKHILQCGISAAENQNQDDKADSVANVWCRLAMMQKEVGEMNQAQVSLSRACNISPGYYWARRELSRILFQSEQYEQAIPHLRWCLARRPNESEVKAELFKARKQTEPRLAKSIGTVRRTQK